MKNSAFIPESSTIRIGQTVKFENDDETGHTVTAQDGLFDSGFLGKGETWQTTFAQAATIRFADIYHPTMHGTIVVTVN